MIKDVKKIMLYVKAGETEISIKKKLRIIKSLKQNIYEIVPRLLDDALTEWIRENGPRKSS